MPSRVIIAKELAELFKVISHPDRIRVIEELHSSERGVNELAETLDLPPTRISQHLSLMRAHRFVEERRDGRHHLYHLVQPEIAQWIIEGLSFVEGRMGSLTPNEIREARTLWTQKT